MWRQRRGREGRKEARKRGGKGRKEGRKEGIGIKGGSEGRKRKGQREEGRKEQ